MEVCGGNLIHNYRDDDGETKRDNFFSFILSFFHSFILFFFPFSFLVESTRIFHEDGGTDNLFLYTGCHDFSFRSTSCQNGRILTIWLSRADSQIINLYLSFITKIPLILLSWLQPKVLFRSVVCNLSQDIYVPPQHHRHRHRYILLLSPNPCEAGKIYIYNKNSTFTNSSSQMAQTGIRHSLSPWPQTVPHRYK